MTHRLQQQAPPPTPAKPLSQQAQGLLLVTPGEPAGIGPDLLIQLAQQVLPANTVVVADPTLLTERAQQMGLSVQIQTLSMDELAHHPVSQPTAKHIVCVPVARSTSTTAGQADPRNARYVLDCLDLAADACLDGRAQALITGPVHKAVINDAGIDFSGHTEYLAARCHSGEPLMMLATEGLRVALATTHLPLSEVPAQITPARLRYLLSVLHNGLQTQFGIAQPHILVAGLNPHAGEDGHLGREEIDIIIPVLEALRAEGMNLSGPLPADTLFTPHKLAKADAVFAMYHDQGLPVLKYKGFGSAVNITLGLPIVRTSVDHGTALDLAATGKADTGSLRYALTVAAAMQTTKDRNA